ncbi:MAG: menaquinone biosynthesis protein [Deltaproteobacteria bacterium]|jgi:chorismate dehydratase|nr:menaquinone biosynthesis protein [Deltaproteobacteria bacterium]
MTDRKPRMGRIEYLNVLPIYHALETGRVPHGYELVYGPPSLLNGMMMRGELAVASTSCIEYARRPERYWILPDLAIGSRGKVLSVLLLSRVPVEQLRGETVLASAATHTSVALLKLLFQDYLGISTAFATGDASARAADANPPKALLVIGDEALRLRGHPAYPHVWDLGEAWFDWTGLPFIFGLWVVSRKAAQAGDLAGDPAETLHRGRDWSLANMGPVLDAAGSRSPLSRDALREYFRCLSYKLGEEEQRGLRLFYERLARTGEIARAPELAFWTGR